MNDDLERQLDEFYRKLDGPARRVEARWKSTPAGDSRKIQAWFAAGIAAAAAILLMISALRSDPRPVERQVVKAETPGQVTIPRPVEPPPQPAPVVPRPVRERVQGYAMWCAITRSTAIARSPSIAGSLFIRASLPACTGRRYRAIKPFLHG